MSDNQTGDWIDAFQKKLLSWYHHHARPMPWRDTRNPYYIWVSEIMLQQTRVDQVRPYFSRFIERFPTLEALAEASIDDVLVVWEGLGYYSRARNLHKAAGIIHFEKGGVFPSTHEEILQLPGIGPYTAAAVISIAFGKPHACLDGNIIRVLTRIHCIAEDVTRGSTRKALQHQADSLLFAEDPSSHNQAMMELGATRCHPRSPDCVACPVASFCCANANGTQEIFPKKKKKAAVPLKEMVAVIVENEEGHILVQQRPMEGLLGGLWEFITEEYDHQENHHAAFSRLSAYMFSHTPAIRSVLPVISHAYSHFRIKVTPVVVRPQSVSILPDSSRWIPLEEASNLAFHRAHRKILSAYQQALQTPSLFDPEQLG